MTPIGKSTLKRKRQDENEGECSRKKMTPEPAQKGDQCNGNVAVNNIDNRPLRLMQNDSSVNDTKPSTKPRKQRPKMTLLGSMRKTYSVPELTRVTTWTVTKMKARENPWDSVVVEWRDKCDSLTYARTATDKERSKERLKECHLFRQKKTFEWLQKQNEAVQDWNRCFGTLYSII